MICRLRGKAEILDTGQCLVDVNGVGYLVSVSSRTLEKISADLSACSLLIETIIREDAFLLFGFFDKIEQQWFCRLMEVQGVGAKVALALLSVASPAELYHGVKSQDKKIFAKAPGVGPRLAARLVLELNAKPLPSIGQEALANMPQPQALEQTPVSSLAEDVTAALEGLGFRKNEAEKAFQKVSERHPSLSSAADFIRLCLKELG